MNGLVLLNKPKGITSFSAVSAVKRICCEKRVGHTGTLDPMATGVLPVLLGRATRLCPFIMDADKRYTATIKFGTTTDTLDITGTVLSQTPCSITRQQLSLVLTEFTGETFQIPPMYSAIKKDGVRLYELARKGIEVERKARRVFIKSIEILQCVEENVFILDVVCSKGTYIRTLVDDIGKKLGCGAVLMELCRTETAGFKLEGCITLEQLEKQPEQLILPAQQAVEQLSSIFVSDAQTRRFLNGGELDFARLKRTDFSEKYYKVFGADKFLGIGRADTNSQKVYVECVIAEQD